jgi:anti-anti-sigma factor
METLLEAGQMKIQDQKPQPEHLSAEATAKAEIPPQLDAEQRINSNVMSIRLTPDGLVIKDEEQVAVSDETKMLSGVYCEGVQYYDLNGIEYINNTGMAILIDLLKSLLEMGVEVQFVNVHPNIRKKIRDLGLDKIINCGEQGH